MATAGTSNYAYNKILNHVLGREEFVVPATLYVALYTTSPNNNGGGTEVTGGGYTRVSIANNTTTFPVTTTMTKANDVVFQFPAATADWGDITAVGLLDGPGGSANLLFYFIYDTAKTIQSGTIPQFAVGSIVIERPA